MIHTHTRINWQRHRKVFRISFCRRFRKKMINFYDYHCHYYYMAHVRHLPIHFVPADYDFSVQCFGVWIILPWTHRSPNGLLDGCELWAWNGWPMCSRLSVCLTVCQNWIAEMVAGADVKYLFATVRSDGHEQTGIHTQTQTWHLYYYSYDNTVTAKSKNSKTSEMLLASIRTLSTLEPFYVCVCAVAAGFLAVSF